MHPNLLRIASLALVTLFLVGNADAANDYRSANRNYRRQCRPGCAADPNHRADHL